MLFIIFFYQYSLEYLRLTFPEMIYPVDKLTLTLSFAFFQETN